mmetsp:Transcript_53957/g.144533  ORF Transcript_53957/g.144533 Transcript_53957/m.144533 type:complete len:214 (+) Transcript_53957:427-1068(+)
MQDLHDVERARHALHLQRPVQELLVVSNAVPVAHDLVQDENLVPAKLELLEHGHDLLVLHHRVKLPAVQHAVAELVGVDEDLPDLVRENLLHGHLLHGHPLRVVLGDAEGLLQKKRRYHAHDRKVDDDGVQNPEYGEPGAHLHDHRPGPAGPVRRERGLKEGPSRARRGAKVLEDPLPQVDACRLVLQEADGELDHQDAARHDDEGDEEHGPQ